MIQIRKGVYIFLFWTLISLSIFSQWIKEVTASQLVVVVNPHNQIESLTERQISDIYLGRRKTFPTGEPALVLEHERNTSIREKFFQMLNGMSVKRLNAYWARLQFSGTVQPPPEVESSEAVLDLVRRNRGAIGYVEAVLVDDSVRIILTLDDGK